MITVLEKAHGGAAFSASARFVDAAPYRNGAFYTKRFSLEDSEWQTRIGELTGFLSLTDDWDGEGSPAPARELIDGALVFAQNMRHQEIEAPHRVVVGMNGTVFFEWHMPTAYCEIEFQSAMDAEIRLIQSLSGEVKVSRLRRDS